MKTKNYFYGILSAVILAVPVIALAQLDISGVNNGANGAQLPSGTITTIITNIMLWLLGIVGVIGVIGFAISGILYLTAAGDDTRMELGKKAMTWSIIGVIVALMGYVIIQAVDTMLGEGTNVRF